MPPAGSSGTTSSKGVPVHLHAVGPVAHGGESGRGTRAQVVSGSLGRTGCPDAAGARERCSGTAAAGRVPGDPERSRAGGWTPDGDHPVGQRAGGCDWPGASAPWAAVTLSDTGGSGRTHAEPPFGTPRTMTVRLVAGIQNGLFWRVGTGRAAECCVPSAGRKTRHPELGSDVPAEQRLQGFEPLCCCGRGGLDRGDVPGPAEGADVWSGPA
jgi:hypothetical protein